MDMITKGKASTLESQRGQPIKLDFKSFRNELSGVFSILFLKLSGITMFFNLLIWQTDFINWTMERLTTLVLRY